MSPRVREIVTSPLFRSVQRHRTTVAYHPAYLTGRIVRVARNEVVLAPATGPRVVVMGYTPPSYYVNQYVTVPAVYNNGGYYAYPYTNSFVPQLEQLAMSLFGVSVSFVNGYYVPQATSYYGMPYYGYGYANNAYAYNNYPYNNYASNYSNGVCPAGDNDGDETGYAYCGGGATPYDNCVWTTDAYGNSFCAAQNAGYNSYGYNGYGPQFASYGNAGMYAPQQIQGLVVAKTGSMLMVLGGNGLSPIFVNDTPALQSGYAMNGPVAVGQVINAYGYYQGNTFVATALM